MKIRRLVESVQSNIPPKIEKLLPRIRPLYDSSISETDFRECLSEQIAENDLAGSCNFISSKDRELGEEYRIALIESGLDPDGEGTPPEEYEEPEDEQDTDTLTEAASLGVDTDGLGPVSKAGMDLFDDFIDSVPIPVSHARPFVPEDAKRTVVENYKKPLWQIQKESYIKAHEKRLPKDEDGNYIITEDNIDKYWCEAYSMRNRADYNSLIKHILHK